jgi:hypothetical protein
VGEKRVSSPSRTVQVGTTGPEWMTGERDEQPKET